jgi:hypothetical protein
MSREKLGRSKSMAFRELKCFNEALLAKQEWRLVRQLDSLVTQIIKENYNP